jgi:hypothetical protein
LTAEFVFDDESQPKWGDGRIIDDPSLPSPGSISGATPSPVPLHKAEPAPLLRGSSASDESPFFGEAQPFAAEIDSLRIALQRLQHAFSCTTTIEEHLKLASAISLITASISRLVRTQNYLASNRVPEFNRETNAALDVVIKEWVPT